MYYIMNKSFSLPKAFYKSKYTGQSINKVIWDKYFSKKRLIFSNIKKSNVLLIHITQQKLAKKGMTPKLACIISLVIRKKCIKPKLGFISYSTGWLKWGQKYAKRQCIYWTTGIHIHYCLQCKFVVYLWKTKQQSIFFFMNQIQILLFTLIVYIRVNGYNLPLKIF